MTVPGFPPKSWAIPVQLPWMFMDGHFRVRTRINIIKTQAIALWDWNPTKEKTGKTLSGKHRRIGKSTPHRKYILKWSMFHFYYIRSSFSRNCVFGCIFFEGNYGVFLLKQPWKVCNLFHFGLDVAREATRGRRLPGVACGPIFGLFPIHGFHDLSGNLNFIWLGVVVVLDDLLSSLIAW